MIFACPAVCQTEDETGIDGTMTMSPAVGGPVRQGAMSSVPLSNVAFVVQQRDKFITSFHTNSQGHFRVALTPGHYTVVRKDF